VEDTRCRRFFHFNILLWRSAINVTLFKIHSSANVMYTRGQQLISVDIISNEPSFNAITKERYYLLGLSLAR